MPDNQSITQSQNWKETSRKKKKQLFRNNVNNCSNTPCPHVSVPGSKLPQKATLALREVLKAGGAAERQGFLIWSQNVSLSDFHPFVSWLCSLKAEQANVPFKCAAQKETQTPNVV